MIKQRRAQLGVDGTHAFSLLGDDLQIGEVEFVEVKLYNDDDTIHMAELRAARTAHKKLETRLGRTIPFYFGPSHPYGN